MRIAWFLKKHVTTIGMNAVKSGSDASVADTGTNSDTGEEVLRRVELEAEIKALRTALDFERRVESVLDLMDGSQGIRELFDFAVREIPEALRF